MPDSLRSGPDIARAAALIGDPARAAMLAALIDGRALTASELAVEAGVGRSTASGHLARLREGGLLAEAKQGRARYFRLSGPEVAAALEALMGVAARGPQRVRPGPRDEGLRRARLCYDHLAGEAGVALYEGLLTSGALRLDGEAPTLTDTGAARLAAAGVDLPALRAARRPVCRACLDWSERRSHLAGGLGAAIWRLAETRRWARRETGSRAVRFAPQGEAELRRALEL